MSHNHQNCELCNWLLTHCHWDRDNVCPYTAHLRHIGILPPTAHGPALVLVPIFDSNNRQTFPPPAHQTQPTRAHMNWSQFPQGIGGFGGFGHGENSILLQPPFNNNFATAAVGGGGGYQYTSYPSGVNGGNTPPAKNGCNRNEHMNQVIETLKESIEAHWQNYLQAHAQAPPAIQNPEPEPSHQNESDEESSSTSTSSVVIVEERPPPPAPIRRPRKPNARERYLLRTRRARLQQAQRRLAQAGGGNGQGQNYLQPGTSADVSPSTSGIQKGDESKNLKKVCAMDQDEGDSEREVGQPEVPLQGHGHDATIVTQCDTDTLEPVTSGTDDSSGED